MNRNFCIEHDGRRRRYFVNGMEVGELHFVLADAQNVKLRLQRDKLADPSFVRPWNVLRRIEGRMTDIRISRDAKYCEPPYNTNQLRYGARLANAEAQHLAKRANASQLTIVYSDGMRETYAGNGQWLESEFPSLDERSLANLNES